MRISFAFVRHDRVLLFFLYAVLVIGFLASTSTDFLYPGDADYVNHVVSIVQAKRAFAEGQFPLRVVPFEQSGWRYPLFQFYSPSAYMFAGLVYQWLSPSNPMAAYQITLGFFLILGGIYMNRLAYWFVKSRHAALLASIVYLASPYYLIVVNHLNGFTEAVALGLMPVALYYTLQCYKHPLANRAVLQAALAWYLLATTHVITFMYTSFFAAALLLLITFKNFRHWRNLIWNGIAYAFGCVLAMWYIAPAIWLQKYLNVRQESDVSAFSHYGISLAKLLTPSNNILALDPDSKTGLIQSTIQCQPNIGIPILVAAGICLYAFISKSKSQNKRVDYWLPSLFIIFIISIVMTWSPANVWRWLPHFLTIGQYPWRVMSQSIWIGSLLFAWALCWLFKNKMDKRHILVGIFLILMTAETWLPVSESQFLFVKPSTFNKSSLVNNESYAMNYQQSLRFVHAVNDVSLAFVDQDAGGLKLNFAYSIQHSLFAQASEPYVLVRGNVPADNPVSGQRVEVVINGVMLAMYDMKAGPFNWKIPLGSIIKGSRKNSDLSLEFKNAQVTDKKIYLPAQQIMLGGLLKAEETLEVSQMNNYCQQQKDTTVCTVPAYPASKLMELPIYYYPGLLRVSINDRSVSYTSVLTQNRVAAAVNSLPGVMNIIKIQFRGLQWANASSFFAWGLWFLFLLFLAIRPAVKVGAK